MIQDEEELRLRLEQPAKTLADRISILDARDKLLRLHRERQTNIETAKAILGTCSDMCPEYERYFREENKQLSPLEMSNNQPDPHAMVKDYRRAGADQEEPLSHELRSPEVLSRTMDYLCCNIVDRVEEDPSIVGEWYDFIWNRTRAIRKDVTQQHLCDSISVSLLEKCTRFHIYCAHALCEEEPTTFDAKINNENLNKCIQSLKDFYNDLNLKGLHCPNEAEFRAYYLLLNLENTNSGVTREIKFLDHRVRNSDPIKFVLKCFFAKSTNDFIKFFDLVRSTTYLNACILHRYFYKVRLQGLKVLEKAYSLPNQPEYYPAMDLVRQFGFNDQSELQLFLESIGVECVDTAVILKRGQINESETFCLTRSRAMVESKRAGQTLSQIIYGEPLPPNPYRRYGLQDSFDEYGRLNKESLQGIASQKIRYSIGDRLGPRVQHIISAPTSEPVSLLSGDQLKHLGMYLADMIFVDVLRDLVEFIIRECKIDFMTFEIGRSILTEVLDQSIISSATRAHHEERVKQIRGNYFMALEKVAEVLTRGIIGETLFQLVIKMSEDMLTSRLRQMHTLMSSLASETIIKETTSQVLREIAQKCLDEELEIERRVKEMIEKRSKRLARTCLRLWYRKTAKAKRFRIIRSNFPAGQMKQESFKIESICVIKRKPDGANLDENGTLSTKKSKAIYDDDDVVFLSETQNVSITNPGNKVSGSNDSPSPRARLPCESPLDKLRQKIELEKDLNESFKRNLDAFCLSLSCEDNNNEINDNVMTRMR